MFIKNIKNAVLSIGKSIEKPIFIKEYKDQSKIINSLEGMKTLLNDDQELKALELDQLLIKHGDIGEKAICFELENSFLPILCLHDLCLTYEGQTSQMDFVLLTSKFIAVLESKKLSGDVTVSKEGQFTRSFKTQGGKVYKKEAIYSPITQNERHVTLLHKYLIDQKLIKYTPVISFVVLANPKSIVNMRYAKKEIQNRIIRGDQLIERLKAELKKKSDVNMPVRKIEEIAEALLAAHTEKEQHFIKKYERVIDQPIVEEIVEVVEDKTRVKIYDSLKSYRLNKSRELNYKAYMIFNNEQMEALIDCKPCSEKELLTVKGFGPKKVELFGEGILEIFKEQ